MTTENYRAPLWSERHPSVAHFEPLFAYHHLPSDLQEISVLFAELAVRMINRLPDGPELSAGLRKLLEAKDCMVRQAVLESRKVIT